MNIFELLQTNATTDTVYLYMTSINTIGQRRRCIKQINQKKLPGYDDWRLPTIEEALSLVGRVKGKHGSHIHPCFYLRQGYVYTADRRKPGGYWFADFRQSGCSEPPAHLPEALAGYAAKNVSLLLMKKHP